MALSFNQSVIAHTDDGDIPGIIGGRTPEGLIIVTHRPSDMPHPPEWAHVWVLRYYSPDKLTPAGEKDK